MSGKNRVLFSDLERSGHGKRFINELSRYFDVTEHYENDNTPPFDIKNFSEVFVAALNINRPWLAQASTPITCISWFYDLNQTFASTTSEREFGYANLKLHLAAAHRVIVDCHVAKVQIQELGFNETNIHVLPYGVIVENYSYVPKKNQNQKSKLVCTRNWEANYNLDTILESVRILEAQSPGNFRIHMAGNGSQAPELIAKNADLIANGVVIIEGRLSEKEIISLLSQSDIYLSASNSDGVSVSMLEAQAVGLPVVVSRIPSNLEWIEDGHTGLMFDQKNPIELAGIILDCATNKKMNDISLAAREKVVSHANFSENIQKFIFSRA